MDGSRRRLLYSSLVISLIAAPLPAADNEISHAELADLLAKWKATVANLDRFQIRGHRILANNVFETEKQASVTISYQAQKAIRMDLKPCEVKPGQISRRANRQQQPYRIEADSHWVFLWTPEEMQILRPGSGKLIGGEAHAHWIDIRYSKQTKGPPSPSLPEPLHVDDLAIFHPRLIFNQWAEQFASNFAFAYWASRANQYCLPAIFAVDEPGFLESFDWSAVRRDNGTCRLTGRPKSTRFRDDYQSLSVILDEVTGRPRAQKIVAPAGTLETIYIFDSWDTEPNKLEFDVDHRKYDVELIPLPPESYLLPNRR